MRLLKLDHVCYVLSFHSNYMICQIHVNFIYKIMVTYVLRWKTQMKLKTYNEVLCEYLLIIQGKLIFVGL